MRLGSSVRLTERGGETGLEHGPQTYLQTVASRAATIEATPTDHEICLGFGFTRRDAIDLAFATVPASWANASVPPFEWEIARVRQTLEAGDHAADLATQNARCEHGWKGPWNSRPCGCR